MALPYVRRIYHDGINPRRKIERNEAIFDLLVMQARTLRSVADQYGITMQSVRCALDAHVRITRPALYLRCVNLSGMVSIQMLRILHRVRAFPLWKDQGRAPITGKSFLFKVPGPLVLITDAYVGAMI